MLTIYDLMEFKSMCTDFICMEANINPKGLLDSSLMVAKLINYLESKIANRKENSYVQNV